MRCRGARARRSSRGSTRPSWTASPTWTPRPSGRRPTPSSTSWPTTSPASSDYPVLPPIEPGDRSGRASRPRRPEAPEPLDAILADYRRARRAERDALAAPGVLRLLRDDRVRPGDPRRDAHGRARPEPDALAHVADRDRARGGRRRLAARGARAAGDVRRPAHRHRLDVDAHRARPPRARRRGSTRRRAGLAGREDVPAPRSTPRREAHSSIEKACMTLGLGRDAVVPDRDRRRLSRCGPTRSRRRSPRTGRPGCGRSRSWRRIGTTSARRRSIRSRRSPTSPSARGCGSTSTRPTPGAVALIPERRGAVRGLGARGFDRRQPAQVAVHAARRLAAADPPDGRPPRRVQPRPRVPAHARPGETPVRDYNEYTPQLGRRFRALKLWILLRWFGLDGLRRRIDRAHRAGAGSSPAGSTPIPTGSGWRPCRSRRSASAGGPRGSRPRGRARGPRRCSTSANARDHGRGQPDRRGVPLAHPARRPVHDPARGRQPADRGAPRVPCLGAPAAEAARLDSRWRIARG